MCSFFLTSQRAICLVGMLLGLLAARERTKQCCLCACREKKDDFDLARHRTRMEALDAARQREAQGRGTVVAVQ